MFRLLARLQHAPAPGPRVNPSADAVPSDPTWPRRVGIWQCDRDGHDAFVRVPHPDEALWADVDRIERKSKPRVLLFGESVARGYFYDPHWNAATLLQQVLGEHLGAGGVEVVDLARSSISFSGLLSVLESGLALAPDACVVFAGNNWDPWWSQLAWSDAREIVAVLAEEDGWLRVGPWHEALQRRCVERFISQLSEMAQRASLPVVVVIPEFNLVDWEDPGWDLPFAPRDAALQWRDSRRALEHARGAGDHDAAARAAEQMLQIDGGTMSISLRAAAFARLRDGAKDETRRLLERARDAAMNVPLPRSPRCFTATQDELVERATRQGLAVVDLRRRFEEASDGGLPDRRLFLDYCHLTAEGLRIAMASVAERLLPALGGAALSWSDLLASTSEPAPRVAAMAHLFAANHNFNWGQGDESIAHHCRTALDTDLGCADDVDRFIDIHTRRAPPLACASFLQMAQWSRSSVGRYLNLLRSPKRAKVRLIDQMGEALEHVRPGARRRIAELRAGEHGAVSDDVDLLEPYYAGEHAYASLEGAVRARNAYHRSFSSASSFVFIAPGTDDLWLKMVYRVPGATVPDGLVTVSNNGALAATLPVHVRWHTVNIRLARACLSADANTLMIEWPSPRDQWRGRLAGIVESLDRNLHDALEAAFPVRGDIAALVLSVNTVCSRFDAVAVRDSVRADATIESADGPMVSPVADE